MKLSRFLLFHINRQIRIIYNRGMQESEQLLNIHHDQRHFYPPPLPSPTTMKQVIKMRLMTMMSLTTSSHGDTGACYGNPGARHRSRSGWATRPKPGEPPEMPRSSPPAVGRRRPSPPRQTYPQECLGGGGGETMSFCSAWYLNSLVLWVPTAGNGRIDKCCAVSVLYLNLHCVTFLLEPFTRRPIADRFIEVSWTYILCIFVK